MYPEWLLGIRRDPTLPRPPDSENPAPSESDKESHLQRGGPYTFDPRPAATAPTSLRSEARPGPFEVVVATDDAVEEVISVDPRVPKVIHFPDS